jgi:hypothetical protein
VGYLLHLRRYTDEQERIRAAGHYTAQQFLWDQVIENLVSKLEFLARKQGIVLESPRPATIGAGSANSDVQSPVLEESRTIA